MQRQSVMGVQMEMDMMQSVEESESLLRVGLTFQTMEARHRVSEALERNYEKRKLQLDRTSLILYGRMLQCD